MKQADTVRDAAKVLSRDSVTFGNDAKWNDQKAWPFWMPFIPSPFNATADALYNGLGLPGITIPAGAIRDIPIILEQDAAYRLLGAKYTPYRAVPGAALTGTISVSAGGTAVTGVGTAFTTELSVGRNLTWVDDTGAYQSGVVAAIASDLALTLETAVLNATTGLVYFASSFKWYDTVPSRKNTAYADLTGTITIASGGATLAGVGTLFTTELTVGDIIGAVDVSGALHMFQVATITTNILATVTETVTAANEVAAGTVFQLYGNVLPSGGTIQVIPATGRIVGAGTTFSADFSIGDIIYYPDASGVVQSVIVDAIITDLLMKFTQAGASAAAALTVSAVGVSTAAASVLPQNLLRYNALTKFLDVTIILPSQSGRYLYGGLEERVGSGLRERPIPPNNLQGIDDGMGMVRTATLLPNEGNVLVRITNNFSDALIVNGTLFGYKVALPKE